MTGLARRDGCSRDALVRAEAAGYHLVMARPHPLGLLIVAGMLVAPGLTAWAWAQQEIPRLPGIRGERFAQPQAAERVARPAEPLDDEALKDLIDRLNAPDLQMRDRAQLTLSTHDGVDLDRIEDYLDTATLSPEQLLRLGAVGLSLFINAPRPAMGVEFGTRFGAVASVTINNTVPGFDAANSLFAGDVILRMDGIPVQHFNHARQIILSFDPEDQITISVLRNGEPVDAVVRFGSFARLPNPAAPSSEVLRQAWNIRRARRAPDRAEPIIVALDPSLRPNDPALAPQVAQQAWRAVEQWLSRRLEGAGDLFDARLSAYARAEAEPVGPEILAAGGQRMVDAPAIEPFNNRPVSQQVAAELRQIDARTNALNREQRVIQQRLLDPNLRADQRMELTNRSRAIQRDLVQLRDHRRRLIGN